MLTEPRRYERQRGLLVVLSGNMLLDALEVSVVIVALPSIGADLGLPGTALHWLVSGFALGFGGVLAVGGPLLTWLGRRRGYLIALLVFAAASLAAGLADDVALLLATRVVKGCCVALTAPAGLAIIGAAFPPGPARTRALSGYALAGASGFATGLVLAGVLTPLSWRYPLLLSAPAALALCVAGYRLIPPDVDSGARLRSRGPLAGLFGNRPLVTASAVAAAVNGSYWVFLFVATIDLQWRAGWTPWQAGLALLPASLPPALSAPWSARLVARFGAARLVAAGTTVLPVGYALYGWLAGHPLALLPAALLVGVGFALAFAALHVLAVEGIVGERQAASRLYQSAVQLGGAATLIAAATLAGAGTGSRHALGLSTALAAAAAAVALASARQRPNPKRPNPKGSACQQNRSASR